MTDIDKVFNMLTYFKEEFGCFYSGGNLFFFVDGRLYRMLVIRNEAIGITDVEKEWSLQYNSQIYRLRCQMQQQLELA